MTRASRFLVMLAIAGLGAALALAADWPQFRGPHADGMAPETGINKDWTAKPPKTLWTAPLTDGGYAGPSVADGKVFIIDHQGAQDVVRALDLNTGAELWRFAYDDAKGPNYGFSRATPTYDGGRLYTLGRFGLLNCLDAKTGQLRWSHNLMTDFGGQLPSWYYAMSPVIDGNALILCPGGAKGVLVALNKLTGETLWQNGGNYNASYATPVIATIEGKKQYLVFAQRNLISADAETGAPLWSYPWQTGCDVNAAMPLVVGSYIYLTSGYGHGCTLLEIANGAPKPCWENKAMQSHFNSPIYYKGYFYGTTDPGDLVCMNPKTGEVMWRQGGFGKGGVAAVDGMLLAVAAGSGEVVLVTLDPSKYQENGRVRPLPASQNSWTAPIVANGKLITRTTQALACVDLK